MRSKWTPYFCTFALLVMSGCSKAPTTESVAETPLAEVKIVEPSVEETAATEIETALADLNDTSGAYALTPQDIADLETEGVDLTPEEKAQLQALAAASRGSRAGTGATR